MSSVSLSRLIIDFPDGTRGLDSITLNVEDGEFVALVGPSGSGKTTLLRTIAGFIAPTSGTVRIGDRTVSGDGAWLPPEKRGLGMVFQQHAVWPHWNVMKNVAYPLVRQGAPRRERALRTADALRLVGLEGFEKRSPATLSGGQRQRVALARALVSRPQVLLLDEALSALDEPLRDALRLELHELTRSIGLTVVHVTHDRDEALALADRIVVLQGGGIAQVAPPLQLLERPDTAAIAHFMSDATVFEGSSDAAGFRADRLPLSIPIPAPAPRGRGQIAILPSAVSLGSPTGVDDAIVVSSLFGRDTCDVVLDWNGSRLRAHIDSRLRPRVGDQVSVRVDGALYYPADDAVAPALVTA